MTQLAIAIAVIAVVLTGLYMLNRFVWFYRDPKRTPEATGNSIISPADGQVVYIKRFENSAVPCEKLGRPIELSEIAEFPQTTGRSGWVIGIYMSPFDVHYNYAPTPGTIRAIRYTRADANLPMVDLNEYIRIAFLRKPFDNFAAAFHLENERNTIYVEGEQGAPDVAVVEIADKYVNKIDCLVEEGQRLAPADKLGFIKRGSQVDLIIFADEVEWVAEFGQQVYGGQTVIARFK